VAIALPIRIAIALAPAGGAAATRVLRWSEGPGVSTATNLWHRITDPAESDEDLTLAVSAARGTLTEVATYSGTFELRKVHLIWSVIDGAVANEDSRIATFHLAKISGGNVVDTWVAGDFTTLNTAFNAFWTTMKPFYVANTVLDRIKVYKDGPAIEPPQVPVYDADLNVPGTGTGDPLPPQVAISVTEKAGSKLNWGRFYMPAPYVGATDPYGRIDSSLSTSLANAVDTLYETLKTAALHPVVYRAALPERQKVSGATLPARSATAWDVTDIQIDDVFDVIRSRRFKYPLLRTQRAIA
jgi:hypothetical protein